VGAALLVALCNGCCGSVDPTTWQGTLAYAWNPGAAAAGADGGTAASAPIVGSEVDVVTLAAFAPWVSNGFDGSYCGPSQFTVGIGPSCQLTATVDSADWSGKYASDTGSANIQGGQQCTLSTPQGTFGVYVSGGTLGVSGHVLDLIVDTEGANLEFQGNLQ
jgi:hypothetical protein